MTATPSPQSVVVPVEPTEDMLMAARGLIMSMSFNVPNYGTTLGQVADSGFYGEHWAHILTDEERAIKAPLSKGHRAQLIYRAMLSAAPAPSSLAGGEVEKAAERLRSIPLSDGGGGYASAVMDVYGHEPVRQFYADIAAILAALSPEAPAREGVEALRTALIKARSELAIQYCYSAGRMGIAGCYPELAEKYGGSAIVQEIDAVLALTPRHEATAREGGALDKRIADAAERDRRERDKAFRGESYEPLTPTHEALASEGDAS